MKNKLIFILWLLIFSFFSCDFGIKENEETNSKEYFTVKGSCSIQGAIPSDLFPEKSIKQNAQRTVVPNEIAPEVITVIFESETGETKSAKVVKNDGVLNFEIELPAGIWTVKAQGKKSDVVIIKSESCQIELSAENKSANVELVLKPIQSDTGEGTFKFSFGQNSTKVSGMKYTYEKHGATDSDSAKIDNFSKPQNIKLSPGVYTFRFDFYSDMKCKDQLLYSFTEVVNIFDGLTTDTWIGAGEYIQGEKICITDTMISNFVSTTVYVSEFGKDSNLGTFFEPVKTIQKAVDKVIAMHKDTASNEENPYKIFLLSDIISNDSLESNNNALVNIDPSFASEIPLYLTISKYGDENATINAKNTGRVMYIGEKANVTLENLILTGGYLADNNEPCDGAGLYIKNNATVKIKNCEISGNHAKNGGGLYLCPNANDDGGNFLELSNCTISGNTATSSGGGILFCPIHNGNDDMITTLNLTNCTISSNTATQKGGGIYSYGKNPNVILDACNITNNSLGSESSVPNAYGGGIYGANGTIIMNDTTIFGNKVASKNGVEGAGVCLSGAELTMKGGSISENKCSSDTSSYGGGVYINNSSTFTMTSGEIFENSAKFGGGVSVSGGTFIMEGGSISTNTVTENGKGVYVVKKTDPTGMESSPTFKISGNACIKGGDDVYLGSQNVITTGNLSTTGIVATITPQNYAENSAEKVQVLDAVGGITLSEQVVKFHVTKYSDDVVTTITNDGYLENTIEATKLDANLYDICTTINVSSAKGMNKLSQLAGKDFAGKTINLKAHFKLDTEYEPIHTFSGVFDGGRCSIEIEAPDPENYAWDSTKGKALFYIVQGENAEIKNLTVKGTAEGAGIAHTLTNKAKISNCKSYVNITTKGDGYPTPGGIVSELNNGSIIENCENYGTIICDLENTGGGIVGSMASSDENACREYPVIANCTNYGNVTINDVHVIGLVKMGGICGDFAFGTIFNCANKGEVTVTDLENDKHEILGGIVGHCYGSNIEGIINCYNSKIIHSSSNSTKKYIGGIVGMISSHSAAVQVPKFVNTVNNYNQILSFGELGQYDTEKNNYYKKDGNYYLYGSSNANNIDTVINTLNAYSNTNRYLIWGKDQDGNIVFSKDISDNQGNTP